MDRQLIKLLILIVLSMAFCVEVLPMIICRTSAATVSGIAKGELLLYAQRAPTPQHQLEADKGNVIFIMDDGWETQYTNGYPILKEYGMKACIAVIPSRVGKAGYMKFVQLTELYLDGWDMLNHSYNHYFFNELSQEEQIKEMNEARDWLQNNRFDRGKDILVFPGSYFSDETFDLLKAKHFTAARSLNSLWIAKDDSSMQNVVIKNLISSISVNEVEEAITTAGTNKSTVIFVMHKVEDVSDQTQMQLPIEKLKEIVRFIHDQRAQINVITLTELLNNVS